MTAIKTTFNGPIFTVYVWVSCMFVVLRCTWVAFFLCFNLPFVCSQCPQTVMADGCLELVDAEASAWLAGQAAGLSSVSPSSSDHLTEEKSRPPSSQSRTPPVRDESTGTIHLLLGCSIARRARLSVAVDDMLLNRARSGNTWRRLKNKLEGDLWHWRQAAAAFGMRCGAIIIWLSGNEAYDRETGANVLAGEPRGPLEEVIQEVLEKVRAASATVRLLGPLPRFYVDRLLRWEATAAYRLDRKVKEAARPGEFCSLGKSLTKKLNGRHVVVEDARRWFAEDRIHLSREGYRKIAGVELFPRWLRMG